eukprot:2940034-Rhodomonas_salina.1
MMRAGASRTQAQHAAIRPDLEHICRKRVSTPVAQRSTMQGDEMSRWDGIASVRINSLRIGSGGFRGWDQMGWGVRRWGDRGWQCA